jgi:hypothetical protein
MLSTDLKVYLPKTVTDTTANGGRMSSTQVVSGVVQNVWPHVPKAERTSGSTKYRKLFCKAADDDDGTLIDPMYWLDDVTDGDDWVVMFAGDYTDTQDDIAGTEQKYGVAPIKTNVSAGASSIVVTVEDSTLASGNDVIFTAGDTIRITDKVNATDVAGNEEFHVIDTVTPSGNDLTIALDGTTLAYDYDTADNARAMAVYEPGDCECAIDTPTVTSSAGTFDADEVTLDNIGSVYMNVTITFSSATAFSVASDGGETLATGSTSSEYSPTNTDFSKPYFTIAAAAWGGTYTSGDTVEFEITPAAFAIWEKRVVPAAASSQASNKITLVTAGESL